jgi:hypothetical protein
VITPNPNFGQPRRRPEDALPQIGPLALDGNRTRENPGQAGSPRATVIRWPESLRRDRPTKAVAQSVQIIDELIDRYKNIEREAIEGWKRSLEDKEIRTIVEFPGDDAKNRRTLRTETRTGNPACLGHARGALDSICKLLGLYGPAQEKIEEEEPQAPVNLEDLTKDDFAAMPTKDLRAIVTYCRAVVELDRRGEDDPAGVHQVHEAGLPDELAPPEAGGETGPGGDGAVPAADGVPPPAAREERAGEPPLPGVPAGPEPGSAAHRLLPH